MSAIGNYIHLHAWNYMDYGINKINEKPSISAAAALKAERNAVRAKVHEMESFSQTQALERDLNKLIDYLGSDEHAEGEADPAEVRRVLTEIVTSSWQENVVNRKINFGTANITSGGSGRVGRIKSRGYYGSRGRNYENMLKNRILELNKILLKLQTSSRQSDIDRKQLESDINKVKSYIDGTFKLVDQYLQEAKISSGRTIRSANEIDMIKELNRMIKTYAPFLDDAKQKGDLFEDIVALIPIKAQELAVESIDAAVKNAVYTNVRGGVRSKVSYNADNFIKGMTTKGNIGYDSVENYNSMIKRVHESQQKVDVSFEYNGQTVNVSAKNLALGKNWSQLGKPITLSNGNPLLNLLQDENSDFVNHYLNLFADHNGEGAYESHFSYLRAEYLDVIKMIIIYKALTGDTYGNSDDIANVFIVNNNQDKKNHVRVVNIKALVYKLLRSKQDLMQVSWGGNALTTNHTYPNAKVGEDSDPWARTGTARIAKLLQSVHMDKIHASIPARIIMNLTSTMK